MQRSTLAILAVSALLTTSIQPSAWTQLAPPSLGQSEPVPALAPIAMAPAAIEQVSLVSGNEVEPTLGVEDEALAARILQRLSIRHTALPERERVELARTIIREARRHDLEPALVIAVIEVESAGYHLAVSHVGALGLMQILPATGEELAHKLDVAWMGDDTLFDPFVNVKLGTAYQRELADRYGGDVSVALAAYNWGPGRIDRRLRRGASVPSRYIEQVMRAYDRNTTLALRRS